MLSGFAVKKPFTVFVCVILVIVLGIVSFPKLTPDLLPNIDLPYVLVITTAPGMNPESVESDITRPVEQAAATLDNVDSVESSSSENVSLVIVAFSSDADMDVSMMNLREKLSALSANWDDTVGSPQMLKINPSMLPTNVSAVYSDNMDLTELSAFVSDTLVSGLEGIDGVASVTATGLVEEYITVTFDEARMDALNADIREAIDGQFAEARQQLADAEAEIADGLEQSAEGQEAIDKGRRELAAARRQAESQLAAAEAELDGNMQALVAGKLQIIEGMEALDENIETVNASLTTLREIRSNLQAIEAQKALCEADILLLSGYEAAFAAADEARAAAVPPADINEILAAADAATFALTTRNMVRADIPAAIETCRQSISTADAAIAAIETRLSEQEISIATLGSSIASLEGTAAELTNRRAALAARLAEVENNETLLEAALDELDAQRDAANSQFSALSRKLKDGQAGLDEALTQLTDASDELTDARSEMDDAVESAYNASDMYGIVTVSTVSKILYAQNFAMPAGYVTDGGRETLVSVGDVLEDADEVRGLLLFDLGLDGVEPIYLGDVADVEIRDNTGELYARLNGNDGILLVFNKQSDRATAEVSENILAEFAAMSETYPGLNFAPLLDQGTYINIVIDSVLENLLVGAVLAVIILILFLRDLRPTFVVACSIPISLTFALVLMYFSGVTMNIISMAGLAVGVGMLVDNSIVVIENIYRLRREGLSPAKAAIKGAGEVAGAITASTLTTVAVFAPIAFVEGLTRQLFTDLALTVTYSLAASLIVALTLVPAIASGALVKVNSKPMKLYDKTVKAYSKSLDFVLRHRAVALILAILLLASTAYLAMSKGFIYMPDMDSTQMMVSVTLDEDATVEDTAAMGDEIVSRIRTMDDVDTVGVMLSGGLASVIGMSGRTTTHEATIYIVLDDNRSVTSAEMGRTIEEMCGDLDCELSVTSGSMTDSMTMLSGTGVEIQLYGHNLDDLSTAARTVAAALEGVDVLMDVSDGQEANTPVLKVTVDKEAAMKEGLTVVQVYAALAEALTTEATATTLESNGSDILVISDDDGLTSEDIRDFEIRVTGQTGTVKKVALADIAAFSETETMSSIGRSEQRRYVTVTAMPKEGENVTLATAAARRALEGVELPEGVTVEYTGESESILTAMKDMGTMLLLGILIVYLIMVAQFQSLLAPLIVMGTVPLAFTGGLIAMLIAGLEISIVAMIGFIMLVGIIVNNGIVLIDCANRLRAEEGLDRRDAIEKAGAIRLRPIFMTALTTILALVPLSVQMGMGASLMQPIAVVCIGGLTYATVMTLYIVPVLYDMFVKRAPRTNVD